MRVCVHTCMQVLPYDDSERTSLLEVNLQPKWNIFLLRLSTLAYDRHLLTRLI